MLLINVTLQKFTILYLAEKYYREQQMKNALQNRVKEYIHWPNIAQKTILIIQLYS